MRAALIAASVFLTSQALADVHYLKVIPRHNLGTGVKALELPDITPILESTEEDGVAGTTPNHYHLSARVNSASGNLRVGGQIVGTDGQLSTSDWTPLATMRETLKVQGANTIRATLALSGSGTVPPAGYKVTLEARLELNECRITARREIVPAGAGEWTESKGCPSQPGFSAKLQNSALIVEVPETYSSLDHEVGLRATVQVTLLGGLSGTAAYAVEGNLRVESTGAVITYATPTFQSEAGAPPPDAGPGTVPDAGMPGSDAGAHAPDPSTPAGTPAAPSESSGASGDSSCAFTPRRQASFAGCAWVAAALAIAWRRRRQCTAR